MYMSRLKHVWSVWIQNLLEDHFQIITCCKVAAAARRFVTNNHPGSTLTLRRHQPLLQGFGLISQDSNRIPAVKLQVKLNTKVPVHWKRQIFIWLYTESRLEDINESQETPGFCFCCPTAADFQLRKRLSAAALRLWFFPWDLFARLLGSPAAAGLGELGNRSRCILEG